MFTNEVKVNADLIKGQVIGNWSKDSYYAFKLIEISNSLGTFGEQDLNVLIGELTKIRDKVVAMNKES